MHPDPPPGPYLVVGLARSGQALLALLGDQARGVDRRHGDDTPVALEGMRCVIKSPGVPQDAPVIVAARERGIPVIGEVEFAWRLLSNEFVGVTGTNGKTTTVELLGAIHREAGVAAAVAGGRAGLGRRRGVRAVFVPARGHRRVRARGRRAAEPRSRPPRPPRD